MGGASPANVYGSICPVMVFAYIKRTELTEDRLIFCVISALFRLIEKIRLDFMEIYLRLSRSRRIVSTGSPALR